MLLPLQHLQHAARRLEQQQQQQQQQRRLPAAAAPPPRRRRRHGLPPKLRFDALLAEARAEVPPESEGPGDCGARAGVGYVERWRRLGGTLCAPPGGSAASSDSSGGSVSSSSGGSAGGLLAPEQGSLVRCNAHPAADLTVCAASNLLLDAAAFAGAEKAADALPAAAPGSARVACNRTAPVEGFLRGRLRNEGPRRLVVAAAGRASQADVAAACADGARGAVRHAVVFVTRLDGQNAFHNAGVCGWVGRVVREKRREVNPSLGIVLRQSRFPQRRFARPSARPSPQPHPQRRSCTSSSASPSRACPRRSCAAACRSSSPTTGPLGRLSIFCGASRTRTRC